MKKRNKLWLALLLTVLVAALLAVGFTSSAATIVDQGYCGVGVQDPVTLEYDNSAAQWTLDSEGTMTISGTGAIANFWDDSLKESIQKLVIQNGITEIKSGSFMDCTNLATVTIANSVSRIGENTFKNTPWLAAQGDGQVYAGKVFICYKGALSEDGCVILNRDCTGIAGEAFYQRAALKEILIPSSVAYIGYKAFAQSGIEQITSPCAFDAEVFENCANLKNITVPSSVTSLGYNPIIYITKN